MKKEADFVVYDGTSRDREHTLLVIEAKKMEKPISEDAVNQARSYALWLSPPFYLVTNGEELRVYRFRGAVQPDLTLMTVTRADLQAHWDELARTLHREAVVAQKAKITDVTRREQGTPP